MRTLAEIIEDVADGKEPTHEECYYALKVYRTILNMDHRELRDQLLKEPREAAFIRRMRADGSFNRYRGALNTSPKEWLGEQ